MANNSDQHSEIKGLRDEVRRLQGLYDAAEREVAALREGKAEARKIAEAAEVFAAERDALKADLAALSAHAGDLATIVHCYENNTAPPPDVMRRVNDKRYGKTLRDGVPPKAVPA